MKILLINNYHFRHGGSETVYFNTANLMVEHGHEVIFFSQSRPDNIPCPQQDYFSEAIDVNTKGLLSKIKGVKHYFYNGQALHNLEKLLQTEKPDVAHIHIFLGGLTVSILDILKKYNIPIIHSVHEYRMVCPAYTFKNGYNKVCQACKGGHFWHCLVNKCSKRSRTLSLLMMAEMYYRNTFHHPTNYIDAFVFVSKFSKNIHLLYDAKFKEKKCFALYNFCNSDVIENKHKYINTYDSYYLYYGRLSYEKGLNTLIESFKSYPNLKLKIVGTGPIEEDLKQMCRLNRITNIEFLGYKKGKDLYDLVENAKFVCVPSEWYENNPMTIIESYSLSTPVIGAEIGGITEIIEDQNTGFLFESGSTTSLSNTLSKSNSLTLDEYNEMKINANQFALNNFDRNQHYNQLIEIYKMVIANK